MNAANSPEMIDYDEVIYKREDVKTEANMADKYIDTQGKRHGSPAANGTQMQSLASNKKRQTLAINDKNLSELEIQVTNGVDFKAEETIIDHEQHPSSTNNSGK